MSRRWAFMLAAVLVLAAALFAWRASRARSAQNAAAAAPQSLAADAAELASPPKKWQSEAAKITGRDGTTFDQILGIEFAPSARAGQSNAPDARAKLYISSPARGIKHLAEVSTSLGNGSFRDVRLREEDGVRTITITRAVEADDRNPARTQRIYERFYSASFRYELKKHVLTLKGFSATNKVAWGVSEFRVSQPEITFKVVP